jgi:hypothetical protein
MYIESRYLAHRTVRKRHHIGFIVLSIVNIVLISVDLSMKSWFRYCWWDFGLSYAFSFATFTNLKNENSIDDVISDVCGALKGLVESNCPSFCTYVDKFQLAGALMIFFGVLSLVFNFIGILLHLWSFFKVQFKFRTIWVFIFSPFFFYLLGTVIYSGLVNITNIESPTTNRFETSAPELKTGFYLNFSIIPFSALLALYGLCKTRIAFIETDE